MNKQLTANEIADAKRMALGHGQTEIHSTVMAMMGGCYAYMMAVFWIVLGQQADAKISLGVAIFFLIMYLGTPWAMYRIKHAEADPALGRPPKFSDFLDQGLETWTGYVSGRTAVVQVLTIPVGLAFAVTGIAFAIVRTM